MRVLQKLSGRMIYFVYNYVSVLHQNINGFISKSDMLTASLEGLLTDGNSIDVLCLTEHNMTIDDNQWIPLKDYKLVSCFHRGGRHGGSCILLKHNHAYKEIVDITKLSIANIIELSAIELTDHQLCIVCVYRPPQNYRVAFNTFFDRLDTMLSKYILKTKKIIICGDFNLDILKQTKYSDEFTNIILSHNLKIEFKQPTRLASKSCLDNMIHNISGSTGKITELALSDHSAQLLKCPTKKTCTLRYWYVKKRDYSM